jgi:hypothetical protein
MLISTFSILPFPVLGLCRRYRCRWRPLLLGGLLLLFLPLLLLLLLLLLLSPSRLFFASRYFVILKVLEKIIFLRESLLFLLLCLFLGEGDVVFVSSSVVGFGVIFERHGVVSLFLMTLVRA